MPNPNKTRQGLSRHSHSKRLSKQVNVGVGGKRKRLRDRNSIGDNLVEIVEAPKPKENGRVTTQELCRLIKDLKQIITLQSNKLREIRADRQMLKSQYVELEEQK